MRVALSRELRTDCDEVFRRRNGVLYSGTHYICFRPSPNLGFRLREPGARRCIGMCTDVLVRQFLLAAGLLPPPKRRVIHVYGRAGACTEAEAGPLESLGVSVRVRTRGRKREKKEEKA